MIANLKRAFAGSATFSVYPAVGGITMTIEQDHITYGHVTLSWSSLACLMSQALTCWARAQAPRAQVGEEESNNDALP